MQLRNQNFDFLYVSITNRRKKDWQSTNVRYQTLVRPGEFHGRKS